MKLHCNVELHNRLSLSRRKSQRSVLALGRQSIKSKELCILWQTLQDKQGTKYKIDNNVEKIFIKFINDGKATIRLKEPPHDLVIQSDAIQLKSFIHTLKLGLCDKIDRSVIAISNLNPKVINSAPKSKIIINKNSDYPTLKGFPKTTEELCLIGLNRKSFDRQILRLQSLRTLNLSNNQISSLPKELGLLPNLQQLIVPHNQLGNTSIPKWSWIDQECIQLNLRLLDISNNQMKVLPMQIGKLRALINLKISQNMLSYLPQNIGNLSNLKYLDLSKNKLQSMPGSMKNLRLLVIDISENLFSQLEQYSVNTLDVPCLVECAAKVFLKTRNPYNASILPFTLVKYLDAAQYCVCGNACFECYIRRFVQFNLNLISNSVKSSGNVVIPFDCYFCSLNCIRPYINM